MTWGGNYSGMQHRGVTVIRLGSPAAPSVTTNDASGITGNSATLNGNLDNLGTAPTVNVSFEWGKTVSYGNSTTPESKNTTGAFSFALGSLSPNTTYHFRAKAIGDGTSSGLDKSFYTGSYDLTINSTSGGSVTTPGEATYTYNASEVVDLVAAADANYHFVNWTGDIGTMGDANSATTNITMNDNYTIVANFAINGYNLTTSSSDGGNVTTPGEATYTYNASEVVNLVAAADANYHFVNWTGDVGTIANSTAANTTITMNDNYSIVANFAIVRYNLTISSTSGGSVTTPGEATYTYNASEVVDLVAAADANYHFVNWTGDTGTIANSTAANTTITMNDNYSIVANFAIVRYNLTISSTSGGSVTTPGEATYTYNASEVVNLVAAADANYHFVNWTGDVAP